MHVEIESAGDHRFDLTHLRQEGAAELVEMALRKANLTESQWRVQVQKKVTCNAETRPLAVVGYKPWCCYVKIKPGDNNSAHFCTLLMPPGRRGEDVFRALKEIEDDIDRNWRFADARKERTANGPADANGYDAALAARAVEESLDLTTWIKDPEKTRMTLLGIDEVSKRGPYPSPTEFAAALAEEMGWQGASDDSIGGVVTSLTRRTLLTKLFHEARHVGYELSEAGRDLIRDVLPPSPLALRPPPVELNFDPSEMLQTLSTLAQEYAEAARRLRENRARRAELMAEVVKLDDEARDLDRRVNHPEVKALLGRLLHLTRRVT